MTPATHGLSGLIVGLCTCEIAPQLTSPIGDAWFVALSFLAGQIPDLDLVFKFAAKKAKVNLRDNSLLQHRGIGHSIWAHLLYSVTFPFLLFPFSQAGSNNWEMYLLACIYIFVQISIHLLEDMLDGSSGICYFALLYNKPIKLFSLLNDVDDAILKWRVVNAEVRSEFAKRLKQRFKAECKVNIPSIIFLFGKGFGVLYKVIM